MPEQTDTAETDDDQSMPTSGLVEQVESLPVAKADRGGYDRDDFGDYDRDALLDASMSKHGCFLSLADDQCYDDAGEIHVDHIVALSEAWVSGLDASDTDAIAADPDNLWLLTASENMSKSDDDPAGWLPPHDDAVCTYLERYVSIKIEYELTVDQAEQDALTEAAADC